MKDAENWFEEGMRHVGMSRYADYASERRGDLEDALAALEQALALMPDHAGALGWRARALAELDRHAEAVPAFESALRRQPGDAALEQARARSLRQLGRHAEALAALEQALRLAPGDLDVRYLRAQELDLLGLHADALAEWTALLQEPAVDASSPAAGLPQEDWRRYSATVAHAADLARLGRDPEARAEFADLIGRGHAFADRMGFRTALRELEPARTAYRAWLDARPDEVPAWLGAGFSYLDASRPSDALAAFEHVCRVMPDSAEAWRGKAVALMALERRREAAAAFEAALRLKPGWLAASLPLADLRGDAPSARAPSDP